MQTLVEELSHANLDSQPLKFTRQYARSSWVQFVLILRKNFITYWRTPQYKAVSFAVTPIMALLIGSFYWQLGLQR